MFLREALTASFGKLAKPVALGGVFALTNSKARFHVLVSQLYLPALTVSYNFLIFIICRNLPLWDSPVSESCEYTNTLLRLKLLSWSVAIMLLQSTVVLRTHSAPRSLNKRLKSCGLQTSYCR